MPHVLGDVHSVPRKQMPRSSPSGPPPALNGHVRATRTPEDPAPLGWAHGLPMVIVARGGMSVCKWATRYDINGNSADGNYLRTEEFMIIGVQYRFIESGDSAILWVYFFLFFLSSYGGSFANGNCF